MYLLSNLKEDIILLTLNATKSNSSKHFYLFINKFKTDLIRKQVRGKIKAC